MEKQNKESQKVNTTVTAFWTVLQEDKEELAEIKRSCKSIIVHGMAEPEADAIRSNVLGYRIVNLWNLLPEEVVSSCSTNGFKNVSICCLKTDVIVKFLKTNSG